MKATHTRLSYAAIALLALTLTAFNGKAQTINVQFVGNNSSQYSGDGPDADGDYWNQFTIGSLTGGGIGGSAGPALLGTDGTTTQYASVSLTSNGSFGVYNNGTNTPVYNNLTGGYLAAYGLASPAQSMTLTISDLTGTSYGLYLVGVNSNYESDLTNFAVSGTSDTLSLVNAVQSSGFSWISGNNFGEFADLTPVDGTITVTVTPPSGNYEAAFNGFQLVATPEPSTYALIGAGLLGLVMVVRRRARATRV